jgi:K+-sensing histidine kinase KdpD
MKLTTKLSLIVGIISTFIAIVSSYAVIQIAFQLTENQIKNNLIAKHKEAGLLATPEKSTQLATYLRSNDLSLLIFDDKKTVVARYGIYRNLNTSALTNLMTFSGYLDKNIENYGMYDIYTEDNIQISTKNNFSSALQNAFGLNILVLSPIILVISLTSSLMVAKIALSPLTKAESISHELKTPLTRAVSSLQLIAEDSPQKLRESINKVTQELIQLGGNVDTLLTLSLYKKKNIALKRTSNIEREFERVKNILPSNLKFFCKIAKDLNVPISSNFINIILRNLLDNAVRYNKPGGYIKFIAQKFPDSWELMLENSKNESGRRMGYGLGMTIVREICHFQKLNLEQEEMNGVYKIKITGKLS